VGGRYGLHELHTEQAILPNGKRQFSKIAWRSVATCLELIGEVAVEVTECLEKALRMAKTHSSKPAGFLGELPSVKMRVSPARSCTEMVWVLVLRFEASLIAEDADT
jgi:hypothetical protein